MERFRTCDECARHVRASETSCPFCGHGLDAAALVPMPRAPAQLSRAQRIALVAAVAGGLAACGDDSMPPGKDGPRAGASAGANAAGSGAAAAGSGGAGGAGRGEAGAVAVPVYGAPAVPPRAGSPVYGAPIVPPTAGSESAGQGGAGGGGGSAGAAGSAGSAGKAGAAGTGGTGGRGMVQPLYGAAPVPVDPPKK
jgi:hypothetical protein